MNYGNCSSLSTSAPGLYVNVFHGSNHSPERSMRCPILWGNSRSGQIQWPAWGHPVHKQPGGMIPSHPASWNIRAASESSTNHSHEQCKGRWTRFTGGFQLTLYCDVRTYQESHVHRNLEPAVARSNQRTVTFPGSLSLVNTVTVTMASTTHQEAAHHWVYAKHFTMLSYLFSHNSPPK